MSFLCEGPECAQPKVGPRVKPTLTPVYTRAAVYNVLRRDEVKESLVHGTASGFETVKEIRLCPTCLGVKPPSPIPDEVEAALLLVSLRVKGPASQGGKDHRKGCKDYVEDCKICSDLLRLAGSLPLDRLSSTLEDPKAKALHTNLASRIFEGIQKRANHSSKRAARDLQAAYTWLAPWSKAGGKLH
jgi:hypothetical protein